MTQTTIETIAQRAHDAARKRDWTLKDHLLRPYRPGTPERKAIDKRMQELGEEYRQANPPAYFR